MPDGLPLTLDLPPAAVEAIAQRAAAVVLAQLQARPVEAEDGYLNAAAAGAYLGLGRKRIHDLTSMGAIVPDGRDGRTPLYTRATLDAYARAEPR